MARLETTIGECILALYDVLMEDGSEGEYAAATVAWLLEQLTHPMNGYSVVTTR